jgi:RecJ-like exonuclease
MALFYSNIKQLPQSEAIKLKAALDAVFPPQPIDSFENKGSACPICDGRGNIKIHPNYYVCRSCNGTGWLAGCCPYR